MSSPSHRSRDVSAGPRWSQSADESGGDGGPSGRRQRGRGDFGGRAGIRALLREYDAVDPDATSRIRYREYDWSLALDAFRSKEGNR